MIQCYDACGKTGCLDGTCRESDCDNVSAGDPSTWPDGVTCFADCDSPTTTTTCDWSCSGCTTQVVCRSAWIKKVGVGGGDQYGDWELCRANCTELAGCLPTHPIDSIEFPMEQLLGLTCNSCIGVTCDPIDATSTTAAGPTTTTGGPTTTTTGDGTTTTMEPGFGACCEEPFDCFIAAAAENCFGTFYEGVPCSPDPC